MTIPSIRLNDGRSIPQLGFGVFQVQPSMTEQVVSEALEAGYRHIDTATFYRNEREVGAAITRAGIPRDELYVTTKLWNSDQGRSRPLAAIERSLEQLGLADVDLYLIHWPVPSAGLAVETWRALETIRGSGKARSIGVSNFRTRDLEQLLRDTEIIPAINQIEVHPLLTQPELRAFDSQHGIVTEAWGPLGHGGVLGDPRIAAIVAGHAKTPAQIVLRWHMQNGLVAIPKSSDAGRMRQNIDIFDFELGADEMSQLDAMNIGRRFGPDPSRL